ncbi:MAG: hypothetical protein IKI64_10170 [Clostridia bacterium]|nr:hypothetical protein [Clostridia bacterium]
MKFLRCIKYEFKSMVMQPEFLGALIIACAFALLSQRIPIFHYFPEYAISAPSPEQCSFLFYNPYGKLLYQYLCPLLASIPVACSYFKEKKSGMDALLIPACGRVNYISAKVLMTFLTGFLISTLPFLLSMIYAEIACSRNELVTLDFPALYTDRLQRLLDGSFFGQLMLTHPALDHFLHISLVGLWSAGAALLTLGISFFFRKHYIINLLIGTLIVGFVVMVLNAAELYACNPQEHFPLVTEIAARFTMPDERSMSDYHIFDFSPGSLIATYSVLYGACAALIAAHLIKHRDIV